jgi:predicted O-methyltransferase YrrM
MPITTTAREKREIRRHAIDVGAQRILEVGAFKGQTTAMLSEVAAIHHGYVVAIDPMIWSSPPSNFYEWVHGLINPFTYERAFWKNVNAAGRANVRLIAALSTDQGLLERDDDELAEFDMAFIDGDHTYHGVMQDIANWGSRIRTGGRLLLHDVAKRFDGVVRAMKTLDEDPDVAVTWPETGKIGAVEILGRIERSRYLSVLWNGGTGPLASSSRKLTPT